MAQQWLMADMSTMVYYGTWGPVLICMTAQPFLMTIWEEMSHLISQVHRISCLAVVMITVLVSFCVKLENTRVWYHAHAFLHFGGVMVNQTVRRRKMKWSAAMNWRQKLTIATQIMGTCNVRELAGASGKTGCVTGRTIAVTSRMKPDVVSKWMVVCIVIWCRKYCPTYGKECLKEAM
jgi:hypothetical protein